MINPKTVLHLIEHYFLNFIYLLSRLTSSRNFPKDLLGTQPWHLSIFERAEDKGTPCWIQTNNLLTASEDLLPTEL
jgi:hypothetical protein